MLKKSVIFVLILVLCFGFCTKVFAYSVDFSGFYIQEYVTANESFMAASHQAFHNACVEINNAGAGNLIYRNTYYTTQTSYPIQNSANEITKGPRGTNNYLMQTAVYLNFFGYTGEADYDVNISFRWANGGDPTAFDIQNCITHEFCHSLALGDLYGPSDTEKTMYGYISINEIKKRTLSSDDKNGLTYIY